MLSKHFLLLVLLLVPAVLMTNQVVRADEDVEVEADTEGEQAPEVEVEGEEEATGTDFEGAGDLSASRDVETSIIFPEHANKEFPAGAVITAVVGFQNNGDSVFKVEALRGSLRFPQDYRQVIQNFTTLETFNAVVPPKSHASFLYKFRPYEKFEPKDFGFVLELLYTDAEGGVFLNEAFNGTVNVVEGEESFDVQEAFSYVAYIAAIVVAVVFYRQGDSKKSFSSSSSSKKEKVETGTKETTDSDWLSGTHAVSPSKKSKKASTN